MYGKVAKHNMSVNSNIDKNACPADCRAETENEGIEMGYGDEHRSHPKAEQPDFRISEVARQ